MYGIVSFLDDSHDRLVDEVWREMLADCTVTNKHLPPLPHFSWRVFETCDEVQVDQVLNEIAQNVIPFKVRTSGLGIFTGEPLVVYIPLIKDDNLLKFHGLIYQKTILYTHKISPFYNPDTWMPHITLINGRNQGKDILCALAKLIKMDFIWEFSVDSIALIGGDENNHGRGEYFHQFSVPDN